MRGCLCTLCANKRTRGLPYGCPNRAPRDENERSGPALVVSGRGSRAARLRGTTLTTKPSSTVYHRRAATKTMADAASQKLANDLARAEARKTLWETELAGLAARREDDAAARRLRFFFRGAFPRHRRYVVSSAPSSRRRP